MLMGLKLSPMTSEPTDCRHPNNASIYAPPRNWEVACAATQARCGVALTEAQERVVEAVKKMRADV